MVLVLVGNMRKKSRSWMKSMTAGVSCHISPWDVSSSFFFFIYFISIFERLVAQKLGYVSSRCRVFFPFIVAIKNNLFNRKTYIHIHHGAVRWKKKGRGKSEMETGSSSLHLVLSKLLYWEMGFRQNPMTSNLGSMEFPMWPSLNAPPLG